jgi:hypothetical protein
VDVNNACRYKSDSTVFYGVLFDEWNDCRNSRRNSIFAGTMYDLVKTEIAEKIQDDGCRLFLSVTDLCRSKMTWVDSKYII